MANDGWLTLEQAQYWIQPCATFGGEDERNGAAWRKGRSCQVHSHYGDFEGRIGPCANEDRYGKYLVLIRVSDMPPEISGFILGMDRDATFGVAYTGDIDIAPTADRTCVSRLNVP